MRARIPSLLREEFQSQPPQQHLPSTPTVPAATFRNLGDCDTIPQGPIQDTPQHVLSSPHPGIDPTALYVVQPATVEYVAPMPFQLIYPPFSSVYDTESSMSYSPGNSAGSGLRPLSASMGLFGVFDPAHFGQMAPVYAGPGVPWTGMPVPHGVPQGVPQGVPFGGPLGAPLGGLGGPLGRPLSARPLSARPSSSFARLGSSFMHEMRPPLAAMSNSALNVGAATSAQALGTPAHLTPRHLTAAQSPNISPKPRRTPKNKNKDTAYKTPESKTKASARATATPSRPRPKRTPMTPALRTTLEPSPTPTRKSHGCWTCKCRRKRCDETRPKCEMCVKLGLPCYGFALERPEHMDTPEKTEAVRHHLASLTKSRRSSASPFKTTGVRAYSVMGTENEMGTEI